MTGIITNDNEARQHIYRAQTSSRVDHWRRPAVIYPQQRILSWRWTVLIVTTLSTLCWIAILLIVIAVLANV
jgi:sensor histidine kinase YesM